MVANDQAYDSHAAQGYGLNNDKAVAGKDTGGTYRDLIYLGTDDLMHLGPWDGWNVDWRTWTYASATTFTVSGNITGIFIKGAKIKLTQTTAKYFYVTTSSYSAPNTTVTITGGKDYTLANAAITSPAYSYAANPQGFPQWFGYTPTWTGFSTPPSSTTGYRFTVIGRTCFFSVRDGGGGTSNSTATTITLPIVSGAVVTNEVLGEVLDNGSWQTLPGPAAVGSTATTATLHKIIVSGAWTASGLKTWMGIIIYEI